MAHKMNLNPEPFEMIRSGQKTIELRLNDEKRKQIKAGDIIEFNQTETGEKLITKVIAVYRFDSFAELYQELPLLKCGYTDSEIASAKEGQSGKPYYIPDKKQFLKYADEYYHEKTLSFISLRAFFRNQSELTKDRADEIADDIYGMANPLDGDIESVINMIEDMHMFHFNTYTVKEFCSLYTEMYNDTRLHINCGHTPNELHKMR